MLHTTVQIADLELPREGIAAWEPGGPTWKEARTECSADAPVVLGCLPASPLWMNSSETCRAWLRCGDIWSSLPGSD